MTTIMIIFFIYLEQHVGSEAKKIQTLTDEGSSTWVLQHDFIWVDVIRNRFGLSWSIIRRTSLLSPEYVYLFIIILTSCLRFVLIVGDLTSFPMRKNWIRWRVRCLRKAYANVRWYSKRVPIPIWEFTLLLLLKSICLLDGDCLRIDYLQENWMI